MKVNENSCTVVMTEVFLPANGSKFRKLQAVVLYRLALNHAINFFFLSKQIFKVKVINRGPYPQLVQICRESGSQDFIQRKIKCLLKENAI